VNPPTFRALPNRAVILLGLLGIMTLSVDELIAQQPAQTSPQSPAPNPAEPSASTWETRHAGDVAFEAPFIVEDGPDILPGAPEKVRNTVVSVKTFKAGSPKQGFQISVTTIIYKPGVPVDLDEAIRGVAAKLAAILGDSKNKLPIAPAKVSGLDSRHSVFHGTLPNGRPFYAALAVVQQGQKLWQVQAISMNEAVVPDLARVMASITINPAP
jgi:hypothetical protein